MSVGLADFTQLIIGMKLDVLTENGLMKIY